MTEQIIPDYLSYATENHASDIFIIAGRPLSVKIDGKMSIFGERLMPDDTDRLIHQIYSMAETEILTLSFRQETMISPSLSPVSPDSVSMPIVREVPWLL